MSEDPSYLPLGFVIAVLGMAGISYWVVQEKSQSTALTKNVAEAPAPAMQKPAQNPLPANESSVPDAGASPAAVVANSVPPPEPPAREEKPLDKPTAASPTETPNLQEGPTTESASATTAGQSEEPAAPPLPPPRDIFSQPTQATAPAPPSSTALAAAIPAEAKMNAKNRRQVQQALQRLGYYEGPLDELFGPATRSAIRRFQESIGAQATGRLNETEASRLASGP
jgi:Putative peptidoglycan binding domain